MFPPIHLYLPDLSIPRTESWNEALYAAGLEAPGTRLHLWRYDFRDLHASPFWITRLGRTPNLLFRFSYCPLLHRNYAPRARSPRAILLDSLGPYG
jgi:hypothetical protein